MLHEPARASRMGELPESERPEALALAILVAVLREHSELGARDIPDFFQGRPEHPNPGANRRRPPGR